MNKRIILAASAILLSVAACTHSPSVTPATPANNNTGGGNNGGGNNVIDTALCFERDVLPVFISNCAKSGCHDAATRAEGYQFTDYASITSKKFVPGNPEETELYEKITENKASDIMPPPPYPKLTAAQTKLIYDWIKRGAPNTTGCATGCDSNAFAFATNIQPILDKNCKGCHSSAAPSGGVVLDTYAGVSAVVNNGKLLLAINHQPGASAMPQGGAKLSHCNITQIEKWIAAGAANN